MIRYGLLIVMFFLLYSSAQSQELVVKEKDGLYGFFEKKNMVVDFQFDSVEQQYDGSFVVRKAGKWGVISRDGREAIPCKYDSIEKHYKDRYIASVDGMFGMIDTLGAVRLDFLFDKIDHVEGDTQALVKYQGKWCLYKNGTYVYDDAEFIFNTPDTLPLFPGCEQGIGTYEDLRSCAEGKMYKYIFNNIHYPVEARRNGIQGQVIVQFIVTKEGVIKDPVIPKGLGGGCNEEVLAVVNGMPDWIPAVLDGKNVASRFTLPVKFVLSR